MNIHIYIYIHTYIHTPIWNKEKATPYIPENAVSTGGTQHE